MHQVYIKLVYIKLYQVYIKLVYIKLYQVISSIHQVSPLENGVVIVKKQIDVSFYVSVLLSNFCHIVKIAVDPLSKVSHSLWKQMDFSQSNRWKIRLFLQAEHLMDPQLF